MLKIDYNYMPQLDIMTFFTQFFWFSLNFVFFYLFLLHFILPLVTINLKYRKKFFKFLAVDINKKKENAFDVFNTYDNVLFKTFNSFRTYMSKILIFVNSWVVINLSRVIIDFFVLANNKFLKTIVEKSLSLSVLNFKLRTSSNISNWSLIWNKSKTIIKS